MSNSRPIAAQRKRRPGKRRELPVMPDIGTEDYGPAMLALATERHRQFVRALYELPPGAGFGSKAARLSGWGTETSTPQSMATIASRLLHDQRILLAIHEEDQKHIRASAPRAIRALSQLIENPASRDHVKGIQLIMDRVHPAETRHHIDVHHTVDHSAEAIAHLRMLKSLEVPRSKLEEVFGFSGLSRYERLLELEDAKKSPRLIEGTAVEIRKQAS